MDYQLKEILRRLTHIDKLLAAKVIGGGKPLKWVDAVDACRILRINYRTLKYYRESGKLTFSRIGNKIYYDSEQLKELLKSNTVNPDDHVRSDR